MKKITFLFLIFSTFVFGQLESDSLRIMYDKIDLDYNKGIKDYKEIIKYDDEIENYISAINEFYPAYSKILDLDNLSNKEVQKALIKDYALKYYDLFNGNYEGKKINILLYGFDDKNEFKAYLNNTYYWLKNATTLKINKKIIIYHEEEINREEIYINKNLKRLLIKRETWDKMSENDKDILWKTFKN